MLHCALFVELSQTLEHVRQGLTCVFVQSNPSAGIPNNIYIVLLGLLTACWSFTGYDASAHLTEETIAADATAGWPMLYAIAVSFAVGLAYLLSLTLCIQVEQPLCR